MIKNTSDLAIVSNKSLQAAPAVNLHHYDISSALQTSLEFDELIAIFCNKIQTLIPHNSVEYVNAEFCLTFNRGLVGRHSCSYALQIEEQQLGKLKLTRSQRFAKRELEILESLLCCLIYPLRNASLLRQALQKAHTDPLTEIHNRSAFNDMLSREIQRANRNDSCLSLIFVDIDYFKSINDIHGHDCGDFALTAVAGKIKESVRGCDMVFRYGGEEFVVLLPETGHTEAALVAERIRYCIESHIIAYDMATLNLTVSLGISSTESEQDMDALVKRADRAMYKAKQLGRNRICIG